MSTSASFELPAYVSPPVEPPPVFESGYDENVLARLQRAALSLLPPGRAFSRRLDSLIARVLEALCTELARMHLALETLRQNVSPRRASDPTYVEAWEDAVGVETPTGTLSERAQRVADTLRGQPPDRSLTAYQALASAYGCTLTQLYQQLQPFRASASAAGDSVPGDPWAFVFRSELAGGNKDAREGLRAAYAKLSRAHTLVLVDDPPALPVALLTPSGATIVDRQGRRVIRG